MLVENAPTNPKLNINPFQKVTSNTLTVLKTWGRSVRARQPGGLSAVPDANERGGDHTPPLSACATIPLYNPLPQKLWGFQGDFLESPLGGVWGKAPARPMGSGAKPRRIPSIPRVPIPQHKRPRIAPRSYFYPLLSVRLIQAKDQMAHLSVHTLGSCLTTVEGGQS